MIIDAQPRQTRGKVGGKWDVGCSYETKISSDKVGVVFSLSVKKKELDF